MHAIQAELIDLFNNSVKLDDFVRIFEKKFQPIISKLNTKRRGAFLREITTKSITDIDKEIFKEYILKNNVLTINSLYNIIARFCNKTKWKSELAEKINSPLINILYSVDKPIEEKESKITIIDDEELIFPFSELNPIKIEIGMVFYLKPLKHYILVFKLSKTTASYIMLTSKNEHTGILLKNNFEGCLSYLSTIIGTIELEYLKKLKYYFHISARGKMMKIVKEFVKNHLKNF